METIPLVKEQVLRFSGETQTKEHLFLLRESECNLHADVPRQFSSLASGNHDQINTNLEVKIMLPESLPGRDGGTGSMQIEADEANHVFKLILSAVSPKDVTLTWTVTNFGDQDDPKNNEQTISWMVEGIEIIPTRRFKPQRNGDPSHPRSYLCVKNFEIKSTSLIAAWRDRKTFNGTFTIFICISKSPLSYELEVKNEHFLNCRKMLENSVGADLELISSDDTIPVKCHRAMLSVSSDKLLMMLSRQKGMKVVNFMSHLSSECIKALLAYIYYKDVKSFGTSVAFALQVLEAATEFQLDGLILHVQIYLVKKEISEFSADDAVKLFINTKSCSDVGNLHEDYIVLSSERNDDDDDDSAKSDIQNETEVSDPGDDGDGSDTAKSGNQNDTEVSDQEEDDDYEHEISEKDEDELPNVSRHRKGVKRIYENDYVDLNEVQKRNCVGYKNAVDGTGEISVVIHDNTGNGIGSTDPDGETQNDILTEAVNNFCMDGL